MHFNEEASSKVIDIDSVNVVDTLIVINTNLNDEIIRIREIPNRTLIIRLMNSGSADFPLRRVSCSLPVMYHVMAMYKETTMAPIGSR